MDARFHHINDPRPRADRRRAHRAELKLAWLTRNLERHRPPAAKHRRGAIVRSKYMPHIGAKQRRKAALAKAGAS